MPPCQVPGSACHSERHKLGLAGPASEGLSVRGCAMKSGYEFQSDFTRTYVAKGKQEGKLEGALEANA